MSKLRLALFVAAAHAAAAVIESAADFILDESSDGRRKVQRCDGGWRGSTIGGYLYEGDTITFRKIFRMDRANFKRLVDELRASGHIKDSKPHNPALAVTAEFKVAVCLYVMAHGATRRFAADAAGLGESTVRIYLEDFCTAVLSVLKPKYMPSRPDATRVEARRREFEKRRGIPNVSLAVDGTHIPFSPNNADHAKDYMNYKGYKSILAVAFVDSFHQFVGAEVGYPGRSGDTTVLTESWLLKEISADREAWLGERGLVVADGGAKDGNNVLLNPYRAPTCQEEFWFNFCHSSTRFFVEETFGRWKNRFRFLMRDIGFSHRETTRMIYASMVLHNFLSFHKDSCDDFDPLTDDGWQEFYHKYEKKVCPSCVRCGFSQCLHAAGVHHIGTRTSEPLPQREELREELWRRLVGRDPHAPAAEPGRAVDEAFNDLHKEMRSRVLNGFQAPRT